MMQIPKIPGMVMMDLIHISHEAGYNDYENGGVWVDVKVVETPFKGAVLPLSYKDLKYDAGGTYTVKDQKLYTYNSFEEGEKVVYEGANYTIQQDKDYSRFGGGLQIYIMKRGGAA